MDKNAFITGITGFAGRHLAQLLAGRGFEVSGISLHSETPVPECEVIGCNLLEADRLRAVLKKRRPDRIFHLAGRTHPSESLEEPAEYYRSNLIGAIHLLEAVRTLGLECKILIVSSAEVYRLASDEKPLCESAPLETRTPYACSKALLETVALQYLRNYRSRVVIARPFNHFGPGQRERFVAADFCSQAARIERGIQPPVLRVGNLEPVRDFLDVRDVVRAYADLLREGKEGEIYNICSGVGVSIRRLLEAVLQSCRAPVKVEEAASLCREASRLVGDNRKLRELIAFNPRYALKETIDDTLEFWRARVGKKD